MFKINKTSEPEKFTEFKKHNQMKNWGDYNNHPEIKQCLRKHSLLKEQDFCCPYCEIEIDVESSETEHIKPKDKFKEEFQDFNNLITACKTPKSCGNSKGNKWDPNFINPVLEDPADYFTYDVKTGKIKPKFTDGIELTKAEITIELLNLNNKRLASARKVFILKWKRSIEYLDSIKDLDSIREYRSLREFMIENKDII
ncbi:MAG: retron system putative HNH endonuclease [Fusobacteriaceae bacterium]